MSVSAEEPTVGEPAYGTIGDVRTLEHLFSVVMRDFESDEQRARYLLSSNWLRDTLAGVKKRADWCSCGRPARVVLDGGVHGPTGYCGVAGWPPVDPCDCGDFVRHDRSVCHIYSSGRGLSGTRLVAEQTAATTPGEADAAWLVRAVWCNSSPTYYGGFTSADEANAWAKRRLDGDIACIGYEVDQLLGQGDSPDEIVESLTRSGLVD